MSLVELGLPYLEGEPSSNARRNSTSVISGKGIDISGYPASMLIPFFRCTETSGGLKQDENYSRSADGLQLLNFRRKHTHNENNDESGGLMHDMYVNNLRIFRFGHDKTWNILEDFVETKVGAAAASQLTNSTAGRYLQLNSTWNAGTTTGEHINQSVYGQEIGFGEKMLGIIKCQMEFNANLVARVGFGMELVNSTTNTLRKVGFEGCNGTGVNWQVVTADGVQRTATPTTMDMKPSPDKMRALRIFFNPYTAEVKMSNSDGGYQLVEATIPSGGSIDPQKIWNQGIITTNSTVKKMWIQRTMLVAEMVDPAWFDVPEGDFEPA